MIRTDSEAMSTLRPLMVSKPYDRGIFAALPTLPGTIYASPSVHMCSALLAPPSRTFIGICALSPAEIKKDIKDVERLLLIPDDTDSIVSDDILPSSFPVRPRKNSKWSKKFSHIVEEESDQEQDEEYLDQAMAFFNSVFTTHHEIRDAETQYEALDVKYQVN